MIVSSNTVAKKHGTLATTGILNVRPGSINTIAGSVKFSLDMRASTDEKLLSAEDETRKSFINIASRKSAGPCGVNWVVDSESRAIKFNERAVSCVQASCQALFKDDTDSLVSRMPSGAGHDSVFTNSKTPTAMIFVPCKDGISHNPQEYCSPKDCALGAQVLLGAVLEYDQMR